MNSIKLTALVLCMAALLLVPPPLSSTQEGTHGKVLILYHSLTGNTKACCEVLQKELSADVIEIKDVKNRSGKWGFFKTAIGSLFGSHTKIEPENPDLSSYSSIIIGSPIWTGKLSMATRTLIDKNSFAGKKVIIFTTTNAFEKEKYKEKSKDLVRKAGGDVVGYYQVVAKEEVDGEKVDRGIERMLEDTLTLVPEIKEAFSLTD
jgi:flavodoxin